MSDIDRNKPVPQEGLVHLDGVGLLVSFIAALEHERERQGMTKSALAEQLGVAPARITEWTTGKVQPGIDVLERWLRVLDLEVRLTPKRKATINVNDLSLMDLAKVHWALTNKSRRVAKSVLSEFMSRTEPNTHATAADLDDVEQHIKNSLIRLQIEASAHQHREEFEKM